MLAAGASSCPQGFAVDFRLRLGFGIVLQQDVAAVGCAAGDGQGAVLLPCDAGVGLSGGDVEAAGVAVQGNEDVIAQAVLHLLHNGAVAFGGIYPRQKEGHQKCPYEGDACCPVGYGLPPAYVFAGDGNQPHGGEQ